MGWVGYTLSNRGLGPLAKMVASTGCRSFMIIGNSLAGQAFSQYMYSEKRPLESPGKQLLHCLHIACVTVINVHNLNVIAFLTPLAFSHLTTNIFNRSIQSTGSSFFCFLLPARRYASAGLCDSDVSVRLSVRLSHASIVPSRAKAGS